MGSNTELDQLADLLGVALPEEGQLDIHDLDTHGEGPRGGGVRVSWSKDGGIKCDTVTDANGPVSSIHTKITPQDTTDSIKISAG